MRSFKLQTGIALITVLLVLSLATVAAVAMTTRQQLDIRRTSNMLLIEEAYMVLLGMEEIARRGLIEDAKNNQTDAFNDFWHHLDGLEKVMPPVGNFVVNRLFVEDLQGRFNLTNLLAAGGQVADPNNLRNFGRLLSELALPEGLAAAAVDWMDPDITAHIPNGAEDDSYSALDKPYRTPNRPMASASELLHLNEVNLSGIQDYGGSNLTYRKTLCLVLGGEPLACKWDNINDSNVQNQIKLEKNLLIVLPERTPINVNTAVSPLIYMMMVPGLTLEDAQAIHKDIAIGPQDNARFTAADQFWKHSHLRPPVADADKVEIDFKSSYFLFQAQISDKNNADFVVYLNTLLHRITGQNGAPAVQVVRRSFGKSGEI